MGLNDNLLRLRKETRENTKDFESAELTKKNMTATTEHQIRLLPLDDSRLEGYLSLETDISQRNFIETPAVSLSDRDRRGWDIDWTIECIYDGPDMVGYAMHGMNKNRDAWLDRFMIDKRFQGRGIGRAALGLILEKLKECYPNRHRLLLSVNEDNKVAIRLYAQFGFRQTGFMDGNEAVMMLKE